MAVAREVTQHDQAHPYSWSVTIVCLKVKKKSDEMNHRSEWKPNSWGMFLAVKCQHASGACQSHPLLVLSLCEASRKYTELSHSTLPFLTLRFHKKHLSPTSQLLWVRPILPPLGHILSALENVKMGKVTAVVMVMHIYGNTKNNLHNTSAKKWC